MYHSFLFLKTLSYWSSFVDGLWLETFRFEVGVRNANFSTFTEEIDHLGVIILTVIAKPPDCRRPNKVNNTFLKKLLSLLFQVALLYNIMAERLTHIRYTRRQLCSTLSILSSDVIYLQARYFPFTWIYSYHFVFFVLFSLVWSFVCKSALLRKMMETVASLSQHSSDTHTCKKNGKSTGWEMMMMTKVSNKTGTRHEPRVQKKERKKNKNKRFIEERKKKEKWNDRCYTRAVYIKTLQIMTLQTWLYSR